MSTSQRMNVIHGVILLFLGMFFCLKVSGQTYDGYTLYSKMGNSNAYLIDMNGTNYHTWSMSGQTGYSCYLLPNHHFLRSVQYNGNQMQGAGMCGEVQDYDWNGTLTWQYIYSTSTYCSHHDIHPMPNGNVLLIVYEVKTASEVAAAGGTYNGTMWPDKIVEIQPSGSNGGTVVWEWHVWDHLVQQANSAKPNYGIIADHRELINLNYNPQKEWMHCNGIDYNPELDQIVFSSHTFNEFYVIDHSTTTAQAASHSGGNSGKGGDILYRWGNPAVYGQGSSGSANFNVVHDAHWIQSGLPWAGRIVAFNNKGASGNHSCVDMVIPPLSGYNYTYTSGAYAPSTYTWRHTCLGDAQDQSSSQKLPNGNILVCISSSGYIYEIDSNQVLKWSKTLGGTIAKAYRYSPCYVNGQMTVTATASPNLICAGGSVQLGATVTGAGTSTTFSWTSVPAGFTSSLQNPVVTPTVTTVYYVNVSSDGCSGSGSVTVTVQPQPTANATATPSTICLGSSSQLNVTATGNIVYTYGWTSIPAGFTSSLQSPGVTPAATTIYIANVSGNGCNASDSVTVTVDQSTTVSVSADPTLLCAGDQTQLSATVSGTGTYGFSWTSDPPGFTSTQQNPVASPEVSTTYYVTATGTGCQGMGSVYVTANPIPATPTITQQNDLLFSSAASGNQWFMDGVLIPGATGSSYHVMQSGSYQVQVTDGNNCISELSLPYLFVGIDSEISSGENGLVIFPNPTSGKLTITGKNIVNGSIGVSVYTLYGKVLLETDQTTLDITPIPAGIYQLRITTAGCGVYSIKVILIH